VRHLDQYGQLHAICAVSYDINFKRLSINPTPKIEASGAKGPSAELLSKNPQFEMRNRVRLLLLLQRSFDSDIQLNR
jgi:hypothetical protein